MSLTVYLIIGAAALVVVIAVVAFVMQRRHKVADVEAKASVPHGPSRLFTDYYAAMVLFVLAFFVIVALGFLQPIVVDIKQTNADTESTLASVQARTSYRQSLEASIAAAQTIPTDVLDEVNQALPDSTDVPSVLEEFSAAAVQDGVHVVSLSFSPPKYAVTPGSSQTAAQAYPLTISVSLSSGSYLNVKRFLADIEDNLRLMDVSAITSSAGNGTNYTYSLTLTTYVFGKPPAVAAATK